MSNKVSIGIDLGTTFSCVSIVEDGKVKIIANQEGANTTPSYVAFKDNEHLVGQPALNQSLRNPENSIFDAKRLIGRKFVDKSVQEDMALWPFKVVDKGGLPFISVKQKGVEKHYAPEEISSMILVKLKDIADRHVASEGKVVESAVITVPAYFNNS